MLPDAFWALKRMPVPIPAAAVPDELRPRERTSRTVEVEESLRLPVMAGTLARDEVVETENAQEPWEKSPQFPIVLPVLAIILPFAWISLRTERLPAYRE